MILNKTNNLNKGFTLLELLIVIGILAILSAVTILVINPAELLRKSRDTQRISDLGAINSALAFYLVNTSTISMGSVSSSYSVTSTTCLGRIAVATTSQSVNSTGWLPVDLATLAVGSPISKYPIDPNPAYTGESQRYYVYLTDGAGKWELITGLESTYYTVTENKLNKDGGRFDGLYEVGNKLDILTAVTSTCFGGAYYLRGPGQSTGGLIFYDKGSYTDGWRYLEAAASDQGTSSWGVAPCYGTAISGADGTAIGTGHQNTEDMIIATGCTNAAQLTHGVPIGGYNDWFLPSKDELNKMWKNLKSGTDENGDVYTPIGGFASNYYWSSSEYSANYAWVQYFSDGYQASGLKYSAYYVRAVRAF
ncbi:MAG: DUF1566 domain-containing protein [Candidatus Parcubacteria bacterium]|nr:DUF1566 domain-containing protein [Candidatus Parcubacteria bacterium]